MSAIKHFFTGSIVGVLYTLNTLFWFVPIFMLGVVKLLLPFQLLRRVLDPIVNYCASSWITVNGWTQSLFTPVKMHIQGIGQQSRKAWYLVIANHQSWVDILVLQSTFNRRIPFLKFFLKKELIYVPFLGLAWWALDFPFMRRYSSQFLAKYPHLKGKDIETTRQACEKFQTIPVSVMNFVEGTRFTLRKHQQQASEFANLLKPKAGGIAFVLQAMGKQLDQLLDVTICYPQGIPTFWQYISGQVKRIDVHVKLRKIEQSWRGDYVNDAEFRQFFQQQLNQLWQEKQQLLALQQPKQP